MRWMQIVSLRLRAMIRRPSVEREMEAEMADHLASETEELAARGLTREEARRRARETMGRIDLIQEECRDARGVTWWEHFQQDVSFAVRLLARRKTFSALAIGTVALGIGSTSAVFSVVDAVLMRPLPYPDPQRLISVEGLGMRGPFDAVRASSRVANYAAYQGIRAFNLVPREHTLPERLKGSEVSANFFQVLGVPPVLGRTFADGADRPGQRRVAVLSHQCWMQRYGGRADVSGQQIVLDEVPYEITGVMPASFRFPSPEVQVWTPMKLDPRSVGEYWGTGGTQMIARLRTGATLESAHKELRSEVPRIRAMFPWRMPDAWGVELKVRDLREALVAGARLRSWMLLGAVGLVLLIAVVNVANLMIGHTTARAHEIALRTSLGATASRLARQLLTEALVLAVAGGLLGVLLGYGQLMLLRWLLPGDTPRLAEIAMDGRVLLFTAAISLASGVLVGLWPAWRARTQKSLVAADGGRGTTVGGRALRTDALLVMTEAAFATVLLVGSGLLLRSLWTMLQINPGFRVDSVITAELSPGPSAASSAAKRAALWDDVRARLLRYPGVREVAAMNVLPLTPQITAFAAAIEDHPVPAQQPAYVLWSTSVTPEHRDVLSVKLLEGRGFNASDRAGSEPVAIISRATARRFWPGRSPIGRRLKPVYAREWRTIVGLLDDVRNFGIAGPPAWVHGEVYLPMAQSMENAAPVSLIARVESSPDAFETAMAGLVYEVCATCAVSKVSRMEGVIAQAVETPRSTAWLVGGFAALALGMAAAGIYGVVNHTVLRRTRELGVRLALGAGQRRVAALVVGSSFRSVAIGSAAGLGIAWVLARLIQNLLFGVTPHDPLSFAVGPLVLLAITAVASAAPAVRAMRIDPVQSLRDG